MSEITLYFVCVKGEKEIRSVQREDYTRFVYEFMPKEVIPKDGFPAMTGFRVESERPLDLKAGYRYLVSITEGGVDVLSEDR